jgi:hypothetical protein
MKKPQFYVLGAGVALVALLLVLGGVPPAIKGHKDHEKTAQEPNRSIQGGVTAELSIDSLLTSDKKNLSPDQLSRVESLERSLSPGGDKSHQPDILHQLAHFWRDTGRAFVPYAWYTAESARLENSEKSLTFAGHLLLNQVQREENPELRRWMALQAKDLLERSLIINPANDSSKVGVGAAYLFGDISAAPMEGIAKIREVIDRDSTNVYAQMTLALGSLMSGQTDKARERLQSVIRMQPNNIQALLMLADLYEREGDKANALTWYRKLLPEVNRNDLKAEIEKRIRDLEK